MSVPTARTNQNSVDLAIRNNVAQRENVSSSYSVAMYLFIIGVF